MFDFTDFLGKVAGVISFIAFIPYIIAIFKGKTKPNRATWWIWSIIGFMLGASYYFSGASKTIWVPVSYVVGPFIIALLSIKYGKGGWSRFDKVCLFGAGFSIFLWWLFDSPIVALMTNILIDFLGLLPTIRKAYLEPETEDLTAWLLFFLGNTLNLFAAEAWIFTIYIYPIYMFLGSGIVTMLVLIDKLVKNQEK